MVAFARAIAGEHRADDGEVGCGVDGTESARDFLLQLPHSQIALRMIIGELDVQVGQEAQHAGLAGAQTEQEVLADPTGSTSAASGLDGRFGQGRLGSMEVYAECGRNIARSARSAAAATACLADGPHWRRGRPGPAEFASGVASPRARSRSRPSIHANDNHSTVRAARPSACSRASSDHARRCR